MKLPSIIADAGGTNARSRQVNPDELRSRTGRTGFDDILSGLHGKAAAATRGIAKTTPTASAQSAQRMPDRDASRGAPDLFDARTARSQSSVPQSSVPEQARAQSRGSADAEAQDDGEAVDRLLKRVGSGDDAPAEISTATLPQDPILALVMPGTGSQMMGSPTSQSSLALETSDTIASATPRPVDTAAKQPLIYDVSVASQLAPTAPSLHTTQADVPPDASATNADRVPDAEGNRSLGSDRPAGQPSAAPAPPSHAEAAVESGAGAIVTHIGNLVDGRPPIEKGTSSSSGLARPSSGAATAKAAAIIAAPSDAETQSDEGALSQLGSSPQPGLEADAGAPRKDDTSSPLDVSNAPTVEMPATALSTLSPPVRQVAVALARLAAETSAASSAAPVPDPATPRPTLARTLTLQINPVALGTVAVRMHAAGGTLDLQLTASDPQTAGLLARERDALAASLQDGHTKLHSLVIQDGSASPQPGGQNATQGDTSGTGAQAQRRGGDQSFDGDGRQRREPPESQPRREEAASGDRRGTQIQRSGTGRALLV